MQSLNIPRLKNYTLLLSLEDVMDVRAFVQLQTVKCQTFFYSSSNEIHAVIFGFSIPVVNPATGEKITDVVSASKAEVREAIDVAQAAFENGTWSTASMLQRSIVLSRLARSLESKVPELAALESLQTGINAICRRP